MQIVASREGNVEVLEMAGRLDLAGAEAAEKFYHEFRQSLVPKTLLVVGFSKVEYISSSGLRVLLSAFKEIQAGGGTMVLCDMNVSVEEVFRFAGLDSIFRIYTTKAEALDGVSAIL